MRRDPFMTATTSSLSLPERPALLSRGGWLAVLAALTVACVLLPALNLLVPAGHPLHVDGYWISLLGKFCCYAMVRAGARPGLGLRRPAVAGPRAVLRARRLRHGHVPDAPDRPRRAVPQRAAGLHGVPRLEGAALVLERSATASWPPRCAWWCWCRAALAFVFGYFAFRSRIKGVYFSIMTQALTFAGMLLFFRNETGFGGNNGFTDFTQHPRLSHHRAGHARGAVPR